MDEETMIRVLNDCPMLRYADSEERYNPSQIALAIEDRLMPEGFRWPRIDGEKVQLNAPLRIKGREGLEQYVCFLAFNSFGEPCAMAMKDDGRYDTYECVDFSEVELS